MKKLLGISVGVFALATILVKKNATDPKVFAQGLLGQADVHIDGKRPSDITVHNKNLYARTLSQGSLGLGEAYTDGWWDCQALDQFFDKIISARLDQKMAWNITGLASYVRAKLINLQSRDRAFEVGERHYDLGNDLFERMLDKRMIYSCAYWKNAKNLDEAQEHKLELICKKLYLRPGMKVLDIGCGWGGLARYMAEKYGVSVVGVTISKEQAALAQQLCKDFPVTIRLQDYRDLNEQFDRIVSVGMFEHVGVKNYDQFMDVACRCLKDDGLFLLHTIGNGVTSTTPDEWIHKYIFPNGLIPSIPQMGPPLEGRFVMEDWHNFGNDYDRTLMAWHDNFCKHWPELKEKYGERFYRMWRYYLLSCAGCFRARGLQLWQVVLSKNGVRGGYQSVR